MTAAVLALSAGAAQAVDVAANGGFETAGANASLAFGWLGSPACTRDCTAGVAFAGNCALKLASPALNANGAEQNNTKDGLTQAIGLGDVVTLTFMAKGTAGATGSFQYRLAYLDGLGAIKYDSTFQPAANLINTNSYSLITFIGAAAPQAGLSAFVQFYQPIGLIGVGPAGENWFPGLVYVDNVALNGVTAVPEPGTYALMVAGLVGVGAIVRRRRAA